MLDKFIFLATILSILVVCPELSPIAWTQAEEDAITIVEDQSQDLNPSVSAKEGVPGRRTGAGSR